MTYHLLNRRLLILACSSTKRPDPQPLPAGERYDGPAWRTLRAYLSAHPAAAAQLDVLALSARYGLIPAAQPIPHYDQRMDPARARVLGPDVQAAFRHWLAGNGPYGATFVSLGTVYWLAFALPGADLQPHMGALTRASGGIGQRLGQLKRWLEASPALSMR